MSNLTLIQYTDRCFGASDPNGNSDVWNAPSKQFWSLFSAYNSGTGEHDRDGGHMSDLSTYLWYMEEGSYTGDGNDDTDISLSDSSLDIKFIRVWDGAVAYTFYRTEDMAGDNTGNTNNGTFAANYIQSVATTGQFQVGTILNVNLRDYYYVVYGVH
jgi:hypothetical protein